jgi:hypothetical protein
MARRRKRKKLKTISGLAYEDHQLNVANLDEQHRYEILNNQTPSWVLDMMKQYPDMTERQALEMQLLLQKIVAGDAALLNNPEMSENVSRLRQRAEERDKAKAAYEADREKYVEQIISESEKLKPTGDKAERIKAAGIKMAEASFKNAKDKRSAKSNHLDMVLDYGPKEDLMVTPEVMLVNGREVILAVPIKIGHRKFRLEPGLNRGVPTLVAEEYRKRLRGKQEHRLRQQIWSGGGHLGKKERAMERIDQQFGTSHERDPRIDQLIRQQEAIDARDNI